jgi:capsular polysaccharide biosynthesis protein
MNSGPNPSTGVQGRSTEMEQPTDLLTVLVRSWRIVVAGCLIGLAVGLLIAFQTPVTYSSTALVVVVPVEGEQGAATDAVSYAQAYARVAATSAVLTPALRDSGFDPAHPDASVRTSSSPNTPLIEIVATASQAGGSTSLANAVGARLVRYSDSVSAETRFTVKRFAEATVPGAPSGRGPALTGIVGAALGLLVGGMIAALRDAFRSSRPAPTPTPVPRPDPDDAEQEETSRTAEDLELEAFLKTVRTTRQLDTVDSHAREPTTRNGGTFGTSSWRESDAAAVEHDADHGDERSNSPASNGGNGKAAASSPKAAPAKRRQPRAPAKHDENERSESPVLNGDTPRSATKSPKGPAAKPRQARAPVSNGDTPKSTTKSSKGSAATSRRSRTSASGDEAAGETVLEQVAQHEDEPSQAAVQKNRRQRRADAREAKKQPRKTGGVGSDASRSAVDESVYDDTSRR